MNIKNLSRAAVLLMVLATPSHAAVSVPHDFDLYMTAALEVYSDAIPPSINTSERFYKYLETKWQDKKCDNTFTCYRLGKLVAQEFAVNYHST